MSELKNNLLNIKQEKDTKILPENIKKGVTIYNVTGTLEGGGSSTTNIVKQFDSIANMQADPSPVEDGLATVYASSEEGITEDTEFQVAMFPEIVVLDTAITDYIDVGFQAVDTSIMFDCWGQLYNEGFSMSCYTDDGNIMIEYTSSDGITYTRAYFQKNDVTVEGTEMDFDAVIKFGSRWGGSEFNPVLSNFIRVSSSTYFGLYKYSTEDNRYNLAPTQLSATTETVYTGTFYGRNGVEEGSLSNTNNLNIQEVKNRTNLYSNLSYLELDENVTDLSNAFYNCSNLVNFPEVNMSGVKQYGDIFGYCNNLSNSSLKNIANSLPLGNQVNCIVYNTGIYPNRFDNDTQDMLYSKGYLDCDRNISGWATQYKVYNGNSYYTFERKETDRYSESLKYFIYANVVLPYNANIVISTNNGVDNGIMLTAAELLHSQNRIYSVNFNINTSNLVSTYRMFAYCYNLRQVTNFNTTNVKDAVEMFRSCRNITTVPNFDTSNVTNMYQMFTSCDNLVSLPNFNTINVINMRICFSSL